MYDEAPVARADGKTLPGRWRATYRDQRAQLEKVAGSTRATVEERRDQRLAQIAAAIPSSSRFSRGTTVAELSPRTRSTWSARLDPSGPNPDGRYRPPTPRH